MWRIGLPTEVVNLLRGHRKGNRVSREGICRTNQLVGRVRIVAGRALVASPTVTDVRATNSPLTNPEQLAPDKSKSAARVGYVFNKLQTDL
jgi:hypothetical protein